MYVYDMYITVLLQNVLPVNLLRKLCYLPVLKDFVKSLSAYA